MRAEETYKQATVRMLAELQKLGWSLSNPRLLVPHATSPNGQTRLWFQSQATYLSWGQKHEAGSARSSFIDRREIPAERFLKLVSYLSPEGDSLAHPSESTPGT